MTIPETVWQGLVAALILKIIWDWVKTGRVKPGAFLEKSEFDGHATSYMRQHEGAFLKKLEFETHKKECCAVQLKKDLIKDKNETIQARTECHAWMANIEIGINQRKDYYEKRLEKGDKQFEKIMKDVGIIQKDIALINQAMETMVTQINRISDGR